MNYYSAMKSNKVDESQKHYAKWIKSNTKSMYYIILFKWNYRKGIIIVTTCPWLPGTLEVGGDQVQRGSKKLFRLSCYGGAYMVVDNYQKH